MLPGYQIRQANNTMSKFLNFFSYSAIVALFCAIFAVPAFAVSVPPALLPVVQFQTTPMWSSANFAPGDSETRTIIFNNTDPSTDSVSHSAIVSAKDIINSGTPKFSDALRLTIKQGTVVLYDNTFSDFFSRPEIILSDVPAGASMSFDFIVTFQQDSGNDYQNSQMSFTLEAGLEDVATIDDTTVSVGSEQGSEGGRGGNGPIVVGRENLVISGENATNANPPVAGEILINWQTNIPATSQVIYGPYIAGPYSLNLTQTNFGYPSATSEDTKKATTHSVQLLGIVPEQLYVYRVVSRASLPTVSYEHTFVLGRDGVVRYGSQQTVGQTTEIGGGQTGEGEGVLAGGQIPVTTGQIAGTITGTATTTPQSNPKQLATAILGTKWISWSNFFKLLIAILFIILLILFWRRRKDKDEEKNEN